MNENANLLISKLIERTKSKEICWRSYDVSSNLLKPLKKDVFSDSYPDTDTIEADSCYFATYLDTTFFLMTYLDVFNNISVRLYVQTDSSRSAKLYIKTTELDVFVVSELKRLYNIVESYDDPIEDSVRNFIGL